jgi:hypothetical protein
MPRAADSKLEPTLLPVSPVVDRRFALLAALALAAVCVVLWLLGWSLRGWISAWPRFTDDAYYYLVIARNAAAGHGFTMDQLSPTNGFHPLWMWTLLPVVWLVGSDPDVLLLTVQALTVALFACMGGLLCGVLRPRRTRACTASGPAAAVSASRTLPSRGSSRRSSCSYSCC